MDLETLHYALQIQKDIEFLTKLMKLTIDGVISFNPGYPANPQCSSNLFSVLERYPEETKRIRDVMAKEIEITISKLTKEFLEL